MLPGVGYSLLLSQLGSDNTLEARLWLISFPYGQALLTVLRHIFKWFLFSSPAGSTGDFSSIFTVRPGLALGDKTHKSVGILLLTGFP